MEGTKYRNQAQNYFFDCMLYQCFSFNTRFCHIKSLSILDKRWACWAVRRISEPDDKIKRCYRKRLECVKMADICMHDGLAIKRSTSISRYDSVCLIVSLHARAGSTIQMLVWFDMSVHRTDPRIYYTIKHIKRARSDAIIFFSSSNLLPLNRSII